MPGGGGPVWPKAAAASLTEREILISEDWLSAHLASRIPLVIHWIYEAVRMIKKLTKHGNSLALVIDRPILDLLRIDTDTPLDISTDGKRLIVAPAQISTRRKQFNAAQEWAHKRYGRAFKKLAE